MSLTFKQLDNNKMWSAIHFNDMLQGQTITNLHQRNPEISTTSLLENGANGMHFLYLHMLNHLKFADRYGLPEITLSKDNPDMSVMTFNPEASTSKAITNPRLRYRIQEQYEIPTNTAAAFKADFERAQAFRHEIDEHLPLTLTDGSIVDRVNIFEDGPDVISSTICAFSNMAPRDTFPTHHIDNYEYAEDGTGGNYQIEKFDPAFSSHYVIELNSTNLRQIADYIDQQRQLENTKDLLSELQTDTTQSPTTQSQTDYPNIA